MKVHTYYEPLGINDAEPLLPLWKEAWSRAGFEPVVLGLKDILPADERIISWFAKYPTINPLGYDLACYLRWFALSAAFQKGAERALMVDLDVVPGKQLLAGGQWAFAAAGAIAFLDPCKVPCAVMLSYFGLMTLQDVLLEGPVTVEIGGRKHSSDMTICQHRFPHLRPFPFCLEYGSEGWEEAPMVHFPTSRVGPNKAPFIEKHLSA